MHQLSRLTGRGICFRETVTCVPNRIGRWVFANSTRSVAATILRRLFWYKVSVFLFAPGEFRKPLISWLFRHLSHDCFSATIKTKPAVAFWQAFSAVLLIFAKVIVCEIFAKGVSLYRPIIAVVIGLNVYLNGYIKHTLDNAIYIW